MYKDILDGRFFKAWELDPSTRESMHLLTKPFPVDATLAVAGTAQSLIAIAPGVATVNIITNPSMETGDPPTGYSAVRSATLAQSGAQYLYGSYSMSITPPNSVRGEGALYDLGIIPANVPLIVSSYFRRASGSGSDARVEIIAHTTPDSGIADARIAVGNTVALSTAWTRSVAGSPGRDGEQRFMQVFRITGASGTFSEDETVTGGTSAATTVVRSVGSTYLVVDSKHQIGQFQPEKTLQFPSSSETITGASSGVTATLTKVENIILHNSQLYMYFVTATKHSTAFFADGAQAEFQDGVTPYCDGAQGDFNKWDGTAHASTSRRWKKLSCVRSYRLHTTRDVYVAYDRDASNTATNPEDKGELLLAGTSWGEDHPIYLSEKISFINVNAGETPRIYGMVWGI